MPTSSLPILSSILARDAMHAPIVACGPATDLDRVARLMATQRVHAIVVDGILGDRLVWGVVTDLDLIRVALNEFAPANAGEAARTEALTVDADDDLALVAGASSSTAARTRSSSTTASRPASSRRSTSRRRSRRPDSLVSDGQRDDRGLAGDERDP